MAMTAAVIGLGRIGIGYDINLSRSKFVLSHAGALNVCPETNLIAGVDISNSRRNTFRKLYSAQTFNSVAELLNHLRPDLIVLSTDTETLITLANEVLNTYSPKIILIEKPISLNIELVENLIIRCEALGVKLFVNYTRRSSPAFENVKNLISNNTFMGPFVGTGWYTNGILNNGSHLLNLLEYFFGEIEDFSNARKIKARAQDCDLQVNVKFRNCEIILQPLPIDNYSTFKFDLFGVNGQLSLGPGFEGFTWVEAEFDKVHPDLRTLSGSKTQIDSDMQFAQLHVVESLVGKMRGTNQNLCTGREGLSTLRNLIAMIESAGV